tara:strand:- start:614 stop:1174 length:561 start_codon:yes stop_codon:yes gene_type:complete
MLVQNLEVVKTEKFQYIKIYKNACTSMFNIIEENYDYTMEINAVPDRVTFTTIREPYERFVSGLHYDYGRHKPDLDKINIKDLFFDIHPLHNWKNGDLNHTTSQIFYTFNNMINWFIDIKDLCHFQKMHFNNARYNNVMEHRYKEVDDFIKDNKKEILMYLEHDYHFYKSIHNSPLLWTWQKGKIF